MTKPPIEGLFDKLMDVEKSLDTTQAAAYLGRSVSMLQKARLSGTGPAFYKGGHHVRYYRSELDKILPGGIAAYYKTVEACVVLGCCRRLMDEWRAQGKGPPYIRDGYRVLYPKAELIAWHNEQLAKGNGNGRWKL